MPCRTIKVNLDEFIKRVSSLDIGYGFDFGEEEDGSPWRRIEHMDFYDSDIIIIGGYNMETQCVDITCFTESERPTVIATFIKGYVKDWELPDELYVEIIIRKRHDKWEE